MSLSIPASHDRQSVRFRLASIVPYWLPRPALRNRPIDVHLVSAPKAGRTWLRLMLGRLFRDHFRLHQRNLMNLERMSRLHPGVPRLSIHHDDNPHRKSADALEIDKGHYAGAKVLLLVRDPRDLLVSLYHHKKNRNRRFHGSLSDYFHQPIGDLHTIIAFYNNWLDQREKPEAFMFVRYEDLHARPIDELTRVAEFIGLRSPAPAMVAAAVEFCRFERMQQYERSGRFGSDILQPTDPENPASFKARRGEVGGYRDELPTHLVAEADRIVRDELDPRFGYPVR